MADRRADNVGRGTGNQGRHCAKFPPEVNSFSKEDRERLGRSCPTAVKLPPPCGQTFPLSEAVRLVAAVDDDLNCGMQAVLHHGFH
jgi:hypothetical protein